MGYAEPHAVKDEGEARLALIWPLLLQESVWEWALCGPLILPRAFCMC